MYRGHSEMLQLKMGSVSKFHIRKLKEVRRSSIEVSTFSMKLFI